MKFSPGVYMFVWYIDGAEIGEVKGTRYRKTETFTLALNDDNAFENTLRLARSTDYFDGMYFIYSKISIWLTIYKLIFRSATHMRFSVTREAYRQLYGGKVWSQLIRYVPAYSEKWKKKKVK